MAKVSFQKNTKVETPVAGVEVECTSGGTQVVDENPEVIPPAATQAVAVRKPASVGFVSDEEDEASADEIILPRLNIVQKVGPLSDNFLPGSIVLNKNLILYVPATPGKPGAHSENKAVRIVICGFKPTQFTEKVIGGDLGRLFDSEQEVENAGGTLDYKESEETGKPLFQRLATAVILIEQPECCDESKFRLTAPDGKHYAMALWSMKGSAYTNGAKVIKSHGKLEHLVSDENPRRADYTKGFYSLESKLEKFRTGNAAFIPVLKVAEMTTLEFRNWLKPFVRG